jgi:hypothetical protein
MCGLNYPAGWSERPASTSYETPVEVAGLDRADEGVDHRRYRRRLARRDRAAAPAPAILVKADQSSASASPWSDRRSFPQPRSARIYAMPIRHFVDRHHRNNAINMLVSHLQWQTRSDARAVRGEN